MASYLMAVKGVDCVVVGADRVAANGDTANKVGTYQVECMIIHIRPLASRICFPHFSLVGYCRKISRGNYFA